MTDNAPAAPAVKTYTEDDIAALMKEKLAAEAKAASLIDKVQALNVALEKTSAQAAESTKNQTRIALLEKELELMKSKYINKQTDW